MEPNVFLGYLVRGITNVLSSFGHEQYPSNSVNVATLALGLRPKQGLGCGPSRKPASEGKCEGMNPHTLKGASTLGVGVLVYSQMFKE